MYLYVCTSGSAPCCSITVIQLPISCSWAAHAQSRIRLTIADKLFTLALCSCVLKSERDVVLSATDSLNGADSKNIEGSDAYHQPHSLVVSATRFGVWALALLTGDWNLKSKLKFWISFLSKRENNLLGCSSCGWDDGDYIWKVRLTLN